ncbi:MAG: tetratricopeptide repeat protein [Chloroflexia bacterium]|nr:tetratricopeptide repeat protein [Chloroflexia bacterium]
MVTSRNNQQLTRKQLVAEAQRASLDGHWEEAIKLNDQLLERTGRDAEALNRKGRALLELRRHGSARDIYSEALKADPANMIARRNLQRLETLHNRPKGAPEGGEPNLIPLPRAHVFIEEVGRTWVDELVNPLPVSRLAEISPGTRLDLTVEEGKLYIAEGGDRLGEIESRAARRPIELLEGSNRFEVYALGISGHSLRVIIREVYRHPSQQGKVAFPRQIRATQELMRERELLFQRDEADFLFTEDDEESEQDQVESEDEDTERPDREVESYVEGRSASDDDDEEEDAV